MQTIIKEIKTASGKTIKMESKQFTDEELDAMPTTHKNGILALRKMAEDSIRRK